MKSLLLKNPLPYFVLFVCNAIWAINTVVVKITLEQVPVMSLLFIRFAIAALIFSPFLIRFFLQHNVIKKDHFFIVFLTGVFMIVLNNALGYVGLKYTKTIDFAILGLSLPIISVLFGWWFFRERIYKINFIGILFGLTGALVIIGIPFLSLDNLSSQLIGNLMVIGSGICVLIGFSFSKKATQYYPTMILTVISFFIGAAIFFFPAFLEYQKDPQWILHLSTISVLGLVFNTLFATALAYFLYVWGLKQTKLSQAQLFNYIQPGITAALAVPILGETLSPVFLIGSVLIIVGVYWGTLGKPEHHHFSHKSHHI